MKYLAVALLVLVSLSAFAEGGQNRDKNPVIDEDGNIVGTVDPNVTCNSIVLQSGQTVYFCTSDEED